MEWLNFPAGNGIEPTNQCKTKKPSCHDLVICPTFDTCRQKCDHMCGIKICSTKAYCDGYICVALFD